MNEPKRTGKGSRSTPRPSTSPTVSCERLFLPVRVKRCNGVEIGGMMETNRRLTCTGAASLAAASALSTLGAHGLILSTQRSSSPHAQPDLRSASAAALGE